MVNYEKIYQMLQNAWIQCKSWLSDSQIAEIEWTLQISFPREYKTLLSKFVPIWQRFIDWADRNNSKVYNMLNWLFEGILFDVENNGFRYKDWWDKPEDVNIKIDKAKYMLKLVKPLIPIYWHRYLWQIDWWPVISVHQTDIIYYWVDLEDYIDNEFGAKKGVKDHGLIKSEIPFWSSLVS